MFSNGAIIIFALILQLKSTLGDVPVGFKSTLKCKEYNAAVYDNSNGNDIIFPDQVSSHIKKRNVPVSSSKYAFVALYVNEVDFSMCSGTLISEKYVLVAAQCLENFNLTTIFLGNRNFSITPTGIRHAVKREIKHPDFKVDVTLYNDIGLLELEKPVKFNQHIRPACLQLSRDVDEENWFQNVWVESSMNNLPTYGLVEIAGKAVSNDKCQTVVVTGKQTPFGVIDHLQICIEGNNDWYQVFSNGLASSLVVPNNAKQGYSIVGIPLASLGPGALTPFQMFTRISGYIGWIESIVWPEEPKTGCNTFVFDSINS